MNGLTGRLNGLSQALDCLVQIGAGTECWLVLHPPHRFERGRIVREAGNEMPVDMGELVAQQFVVDLSGLVNLAQNFGGQIDFFDQLKSFGGRQMKEFCRMAAEDQHCPTGKKLIVMKIGPRQSEVGDEMVGVWPGA